MLRMYYGLQGGGKTYSMIDDCLLDFRIRPFQIYANIDTLVAPEAIYYHRIEDLVEVADGRILLDEAGICMPAQFWHEVGRDMLQRLCQLRHDGLDLHYTIQRRDGANVNLREQTAQFVECRRFIRLCWRRVYAQDERKPLASSMRLFSPLVFGLYDTHTSISATGGSIERRRSQTRSLAVERLAAKRKGPSEPRKRSLLVEHWWDRIDPRGGTTQLFLAPPVREVYVWLRDRELLGEHWADAVRGELARRAWLTTWGLTVDDVPNDCSPWKPWLKGHDPESVRERCAQLDIERSADKLAHLSVSSRRRSAAA